jgi:hypothetical protein
MSDRGTPISYNPRVTPNWMYQNQNADNLRFEKIQTIGDKLISL